MSRGQTTLDYAIGISIFLLTIGVVFTFVPLSYDPLRTDWGTDAMEADRAVSHLTGSTLVREPDSPFVLDTTETIDFFEESDDTLPEDLGLPPDRQANVTLQDESGVVVLNGKTMERGDQLSDGRTVVVAKRSVLVDETQYRLFVRVW
mgnify:CR=1 FL=1